MKNKKIVIVTVLAVLLVAVILMGIHILSDRSGPEISISEGKTYSEGMSTSALLKGVTATDSSGRDVSSTLIVAKVIILNDGEHARITYAATDKSNRLSQKSVTIPYSGSIPDEEETTSGADTLPDETTEGPAEAPTQEGTAAPDTPAQTTTASEAEETTPVATKSAEAPVLYLTTTNATVKKGAEVKWLSYVDNITDDKDARNTLFQYIMIKDYPDVNTPGDYVMKYSCKDTDGNESPTVELHVHIIE